MPQEFNISRRKALAALGTIGVASAGAGVGTTAYFSDTESFDDNMITAGELDLKVDYVVHEDQGDLGGRYTINSFTGEVNGEDAEQAVTLNGSNTAMSQDLDDLKPGDSGHSYFCFTIDDNPAYLWACGALTANDENSVTEPEAVAEGETNAYDPEGDIDGDGELADAIQVTVSYCDINKETGEKASTGEEITSGSLKDVLNDFSKGIPLDAEGGEGILNPGNQDYFEGTSGNAASNPCICFEWNVPTSVGNVIQTDSVKFDLQFIAQQARHNDGTNNPCGGITTTTGDGFAKVQENFNGDETKSGGARARYGNNDGGSAPYELIVGDDPGSGGSGETRDNYEWSSGQSVDWTVSYEASSDELSFEFDGNSINQTLSSQPDGRIAVQGKADEGTVDVSNVELDIDGSDASLTGPTAVSATNDDATSDSRGGRQIAYLVINTDLDGSTDFTLTGDATVTLQDDYPGGDEDVAFDVVLE